MFQRFHATCLITALAIPTMLSAAPADFGIGQGHAYTDLDISAELTRARGGGTTVNPYIWLNSSPVSNSLWPEVAVMATPETGVCSVSGFAIPEALPEGQVQRQTINYVTTHLKALEDELGRHLYVSEDGLVSSFDPEMVLSSMQQAGFAIFVSAAEKRPDVTASEFYVSYDGEMFESAYRIIYQNGDRCEEIISSY